MVMKMKKLRGQTRTRTALCGFVLAAGGSVRLKGCQPPAGGALRHTSYLRMLCTLYSYLHQCALSYLFTYTIPCIRILLIFVQRLSGRALPQNETLGFLVTVCASVDSGDHRMAILAPTAQGSDLECWARRPAMAFYIIASGIVLRISLFATISPLGKTLN